MNETILRYAIAVYEEKNVTKAAQKLFVAQPTLSQGIKLLEEDLGIKLFDRSRTPVRVTEAGEIFIHWAKYVISSEWRMRNHLSDLSEGKLRKLNIGLSSQICNEILPDVLQHFYSVTTGCEVVLKKSFSTDIKSLMDSDSFDFLIDRPHPKYSCIHIAEEEILLAAPASFKFPVTCSEAYPSVSISDLASTPLIALSDSEPYIVLISDIYKLINSTPKIVLECHSPQVAHSMVARNIGVTLLPKCCIENNQLANVCYYKLAELPLSLSITALHREDRPLSKDAHLFISILKDKFSDCVGPDSVHVNLINNKT